MSFLKKLFGSHFGFFRTLTNLLSLLWISPNISDTSHFYGLKPIWVMSHSKRVAGDHIGFWAATKQLYLWFSLSVYLSHLFDYVRIFVSSWNIQELLPNDRNEVHAKAEGQRWKVNVIQVKTQLSRFRTLTPILMHMEMKWYTKLDVA